MLQISHDLSQLQDQNFLELSFNEDEKNDVLSDIIFSPKEINEDRFLGFDNLNEELHKTSFLINHNSKEPISKSSIILSKIYMIKKFGKKRERQVEPNQKSHNKYSPDNILKKVQVHFLNFIISILNDILMELNYTERFLKITYKLKNDICKEYVKSLKNKKISDIFCFDISAKYKNKDKSTNRIIYYKIKDNEILNKVLDARYIDFFDIYYKSKSKYINFTKIGLEKEVRRSLKTEIFYDLFKKYEHDKEYIKNLNNAISQNYLNSKIKFILN